jgi:UDPglucose 6-dehydrogenase
MKLCVIGCGYVGLVTGSCLADIGHEVICTDSDGKKIEVLNRGELPIYEPLLGDIVIRNSSAGKLAFTTAIDEAIGSSDAIFICVGTPPLEDGSADLRGIEQVARRIASQARSNQLVIEKSTVPVQTGRRIQAVLQLYAPSNAGFHVASNPEFLREGSAVKDFMHPERIVVGVEDDRSEPLLRSIYQPILDRKFLCPIDGALCDKQPVPTFVATSINSAELIKHASNSFLALKISYANLVAEICERLGADVEEVTRAMGLDRRIGPEFLRAGLGFGGFCFPKDIQAFIHVAETAGVNVRMLREAEQINKHCIERMLKQAKEALWILRDKVVTVLGLSFKPETDDTRFSQGIELIHRLMREGAVVRAFDPHALNRAVLELPELIACADEYDAAKGADALIIATEWSQFRDLDWKRIRSLMSRPLILDGRNFLDPWRIRELGFTYYCMGRAEFTPTAEANRTLKSLP